MQLREGMLGRDLAALSNPINRDSPCHDQCLLDLQCSLCLPDRSRIILTKDTPPLLSLALASSGGAGDACQHWLGQGGGVKKSHRWQLAVGSTSDVSFLFR